MAYKYNPLLGLGLDQTGTGGGGSTSPGGSDTQIQFNDDGDFGGSADLTWDDTGKVLGVGGDIDLDGSYRGNIVAVGALDIDCSAGNYFTKTINGASTFTVSNVPSSRSYGFTLELTHTSGAITWFSGVEWPASTAPTLTTGKTHLFMFVTDDGGTRWRGAALVDYTN